MQRQAKAMRERAVNDLRNLAHPIERIPEVDELRVSGNGVVSSDWHVPMISHETAVQMMEHAIAHKCTDFLVIAGDLFNLDSLSDYLPKQPTADLPTEIAHVPKLLRLMLKVFKVIVITKGNHDFRLQKALGYKLRFEHTIKMMLPDITPDEMSRILVTTNDYAVVDTPAGPWHCCHTNQYSKIPLAVPRELCSIELMHVAAAHRHHHAVGKDKSGNFFAVELGGLFDASKTSYLRQWTTTFPKWTPGYMLLHEGLPYLPLLAPAPPV